MRYVMQKKLFSLGGDYHIRDEEGHDVYYVDGKALSLRDQLSFQDLQKQELAFIQRKVLSWGPTYEIHRNGELFAVVQKHLFKPFHHRFTIDVAGPDDLEAEGTLLNHEYTFKRGERVVAEVSKKWFSIPQTYGVDITPDQDDVLILASTVVIDAASHHSGH
jgi:uncharacterized protein YxjI